MRKSALNPKQYKALSYILESNSVEKAAQKAGVSRSTIYNWMRDPRFKEQLEREKRAVFEEGLNALKMATAKAARTLIELLECRDLTTKRLAAKEIISISIKVAELQDIEERVERIEEFLESK
jgi:transposase